MRVYFIGSHSVGKSTLARYVSEQYRLPMITEVARMVLSEQELQVDRLRHDMQVVNNYQRQVFFRQLQEENKHTDFVSDRSFDCLSYAAQHSSILPELLASSELTTYLNKLRQPETVLFFVRPCRETLGSDGVREAISWEGVVEIDAMTKLFLKMWDLPHFQISMSNMQERVQLVDAVLRLKGC